MVNINKEKSWAIFDQIAKRYDLLNHLLSLGIDKGWRRTLCKKLVQPNHKEVLDLCCGTGDLTFALSKLSQVEKITGVDLSQGMLEVAALKRLKSPFASKITFQNGDGESPPFANESYDLITIAFGIRNLPDPQKALKNYHRLLRSGGTLIVLEFSKPNPLFNLIFAPYFKYILPKVGSIISKDKMAYSYLFESVQEFPSGVKFLTMMMRAGFNTPKLKKLTFGVATLYWAIKE